jgi:NADH:ubiquinone oxidoreductase subunit 4 (subunit M)
MNEEKVYVASMALCDFVWAYINLSLLFFFTWWPVIFIDILCLISLYGRGEKNDEEYLFS